MAALRRTARRPKDHTTRHSRTPPQDRAPPPITFGSVIDGTVVSSEPQAGSDVALLTGLVADEASALNPSYGHATPASLKDYAERVFGADAARLLSLYPAPDDATAGEASTRIRREFDQASAWVWAGQHSQAKHAPLYMYMRPGTSSRARRLRATGRFIPARFHTFSALSTAVAGRSWLPTASCHEL